MVKFNEMNCRLSTTWKLRVLGCAAALSALSSTSFALSVTKDYTGLEDTGWNRWTALETGASALTVSTSSQAVVSSSAQENTTVMNAASTAVSQATASVQSASTMATSLPTTSSLANINPSFTTLNLAPGVYNVSSSMLNQGTLTLTAAGYFTLSITTHSTLNSGKVLLSGGTTWGNVLFNYAGTSDVVISGTVSQGGSVLQGVLVALNATVSPAVIVSSNNTSLGGDLVPPPPPINEPRLTVPDSGSTGILSCLSCLALALFRFGVSSYPTRRRFSP